MCVRLILPVWHICDRYFKYTYSKQSSLNQHIHMPSQPPPPSFSFFVLYLLFFGGKFHKAFYLSHFFGMSKKNDMYFFLVLPFELALTLTYFIWFTSTLMLFVCYVDGKAVGFFFARQLGDRIFDSHFLLICILLTL